MQIVSQGRDSTESDCEVIGWFFPFSGQSGAIQRRTSTFYSD